MGEANRRKRLDSTFGKTKLTTAEEANNYLCVNDPTIVMICLMMEFALGSKGVPGITVSIPRENLEASGLSFVDFDEVPDPKIKAFLNKCVFPQVRAFLLFASNSGQAIWFAMDVKEVERLREILRLKLKIE